MGSFDLQLWTRFGAMNHPNADARAPASWTAEASRTRRRFSPGRLLSQERLSPSESAVAALHRHQFCYDELTLCRLISPKPGAGFQGSGRDGRIPLLSPTHSSLGGRRGRAQRGLLRHYAIEARCLAAGTGIVEDHFSIGVRLASSDGGPLHEVGRGLNDVGFAFDTDEGQPRAVRGQLMRRVDLDVHRVFPGVAVMLDRFFVFPFGRVFVALVELFAVLGDLLR